LKARSITAWTAPGETSFTHQPGAQGAIAGRLSADPWTFIRSGAASALGAMPATAPGDAALAKVLGDSAAEVRGRALDALGAHRATAHLEAVRDRAEDKEEDLEVRARAILALGGMCDRGSVDLWTRLALRAKTPLDERERRLGAAAIAALGMVHPGDVAARLGPLLEKDAPPGVRETVKAALAGGGPCR
jgi:HEAT repeat protein